MANPFKEMERAFKKHHDHHSPLLYFLAITIIAIGIYSLNTSNRWFTLDLGVTQDTLLLMTGTACVISGILIVLK